MLKADREDGVPTVFARGARSWILFYFCCASVLISFNISALIAAIPSIARSLNINPNDAGAIIPFYMLPYGLCALAYAPLASRFSIKCLMIASCLLFALGNWMCVWSTSMAVILTGRVIAGVGAAAVTPLALMTLGKIYETQLRGRVIGLFFSAAFIGSIFGLLLSALAHWTLLYSVPAIMGVMLAGAFFFCPNDGMQANRGVSVNYLDAFRLKGLRRILVFIFFMSLFFHGVCKWYGVYLDKIYNYNQFTISLLIILTAVASSIGQNIGGYITDKFSRARSCYVGISILGVCVAALYGHYSMLVLTGVLCMISVGWTIAHNGISTILTDFSDEYRGELAALNSAVRFFSGGIGFYVSGNFVQMNFPLTFLVIGGLMLVQVLFISKIVPEKGQLCPTPQSI